MALKSMQPAALYAVILLGTAACTQPVADTAPAIKIPTHLSPDYELVWNQEFDQTGETGRPMLPDEQVWWYETGNHGWGNNEPQYYVNGIHGQDTVARIENGILRITAQRTQTPIEGADIISCRINTRESWTYGYFEARAKVPGGKGTWAAFWMMPKNYQSWPLDGEIDIMEYVGYRPFITQSSVHTLAFNHKIKTEKTAMRDLPTAESDFHVYGLEWTPDRITGYVDGESYFTFDNDGKGNKETWPFDAPFYLKLNLAIGGDWGGMEGIDEAIFPAVYDIDYVRVYQKKNLKM